MSKKRKLIVIGGGDFCREILWTANSIDSDHRDWEPVGVLDDSPVTACDRLAKAGFPLPVLGSVADHQPSADEVFLPAIGNPKSKLKTCELIAARGGSFTNLIHPSAIISPDAQLGEGVFCFVNSVISVGAVLSDFVSLNVGAVVGHDVRVGRGCTLSPGSLLCGRVELEMGVFVGTGATVVPGVRVGEFVSLGAGSVAITSLAPHATVLGVPARPFVPSRQN